LSMAEIDVVVEVLDKKFGLADLSIEVLPPDIFKWELGGLTDPIGQLINWLWTQIQGAISILRTALEGALWTVRDFLKNSLTYAQDFLSNLISGVASTLSSVYNIVKAIPTTLSTLMTPITNAITGIGTAISGFGSYLTSIYNSLQGLVSSITSALTSSFKTIQDWLSSAIASVSTAISSLGSTFTSYISTISQSIGSLVSSISKLGSDIISSISASIQGIAQTISTAISGVTSYLSGLAQTIASSFAGVTTYLSTFGQSVISAISGVTTYLTTIAQTIASSFTGITTYLSTFGQGILSAITGIRDFFSNAVATLGDTFQKVATNIVSSLSGIFQTIGTTITTALTGVSTYLSGIGQTLASSFATIGTQLGTFGEKITQTVIGLKDWLLEGLKTVSLGLTQLWDGLKTWVADIPKFFQETWSMVTGGLAQFGKTLTGFWENVQTFFTNAYNTLTGSVREVMTTLGGFTNPLVTISNTFNQFVSAIVGFFKDPWSALGNVLTTALKSLGIDLTPMAKAIDELRAGLVTFLKDPWAGLGKILTEALKALGIDVTPITKAIQEVKTGFVDFLKDPWTKLGEILTNAFKALGIDLTILNKWLPSATQFFEGVLKGQWTRPLVDALQVVGLWDWLKGISKFFTDSSEKGWMESMGKFFKDLVEGKILESIQSFIKDPWGSITNAFAKIIDWGKTTLFPAIEKAVTPIFDFLKNVAQSVWGALSGFFQTGFQWIAGGVKELLTFFSPKSPSILDDLAKFFADLLGNIFIKPFAMIPKMVFDRTQSPDLPKETPMEATVAYMGGLMLQAVAFPYMLSALMRAIGGGIGISFEGGLPKLTGKIDIKPALLVKHLAKVIWKLPDVFLGSLGYGFGIWLTQPILRVVNSFKRNEMPIEMPNLQEIREMANRASVLENYREIWGELTQFMAYYGYSDRNVAWNLGFYNTLFQLIQVDPTISVKDRFGNTVDIPLALRHKMPSGSDFATMMVRDVFATFEDFDTAMTVQGYGSDVSKLYYLLHYKYPPMDQLWRFIARVSAGFGWATGAFEKPAGLGFDGKTPKDLSAQYAADPVKGLQDLSAKILPYAKWHDYAPFAWMTDFTSDRLIMLDLMARLPDRIEGRWMYKWSIIDDLGLQRLVVAEGFHPNMVENVAVAEAMNALTEERSAAKTGILNIYEAGFFSLAQVNQKLQQITTVTILGKERTVKLLDGERKLELIRSGYDRAKAVLSGIWRNITTAFSANLYKPTEVLPIVQDITTNLKKVLGLDLQVDEAFLSVWLQTYEIRWRQQTVQRIRSLMRVFIYRASQLAEAGEDVADLIDKFAMTAFLTPVEAEIMKLLALAFVKASQKAKKITVIKQIVSGRLKRGEITTEQAITELMAAGMTKDEAIAWLESTAKFRTVSSDKLISMSEYIPIDQQLLKDKMDAEGVPLNEQKLYFPYQVAMDVSEEMGRLATEYIDDYVAGSFGLEQLIKNFDDLATMNGTVKQSLGVDWIVLSPTERQLLVTLAKMRKQRTAGVEGEAKELTSSRLITMMEQIPVSIEKLRRQMTKEGLAAEDQTMNIAYALSTQYGEEMTKLANQYIDDYVDGLGDLATLKANVDSLATLNGTVKAQLGVDWVVFSPEERAYLIASAQSRRRRADLAAEKEKPLTSSRLITMMEQIPISIAKLRTQMTKEGISVEDQNINIAYALSGQYGEEMTRLANEYINDYVAGMGTLENLKTNIDALATLNGTVKQSLGVDWVVLSPEERAYLTTMAQSRRIRQELSAQKEKPLTSSTLITMMEQVPISVDKLRAKLIAEGVPEDDLKPRIAYAVATQFSEEIGRLANEYLEDYVQALMDLPALKTALDSLATLNGTVKESLGVDWIVLSPEERTLLTNLAMVRRQRNEAPKTKKKVLTTEKLITMMENVPVASATLVDKMNIEGIPTDEQKLMLPYSVAREISAEMGRIVTELITDHANGVINIQEFEQSLNELATLGGVVPQALGVDWIVLSPLERQLFVNLAKLRRMRVLAKQGGAK